MEVSLESVTISPGGVPIRLTDERWRHIVGRHPELDGLRELVLETVARPDMIQRGGVGELLAVRYYPETSLGGKFLVVAYREAGPSDGFILTAYLTRGPSGRPVIWTR